MNFNEDLNFHFVKKIKKLAFMKKYLWCFHLLSTLINADSNEIIMQVNNDSSIESTTLINEIATTEAAENHIAGMNYYLQQQNNLH